MLFTIGPKTKAEDMYDREAELAELAKSTELKERLVIVYGTRRTGKTSLLRAFLNSRRVMFAFIDVRTVYFDNMAVPSDILAELLWITY